MSEGLCYSRIDTDDQYTESIGPDDCEGRLVVDQSDIRDAIELFQYSLTARAGGRAADVTRNLWDLYK